MTWPGIFLSFIIGGTVTALIVALEESGLRTWSGLAALAPVFTLVSYIFIGFAKGPAAVSQHSKFVLVGTLVSWAPYMAVVAFTAPKLGVTRAIALGLLTFFVLAVAYVWFVEKNQLFR